MEINNQPKRELNAYERFQLVKYGNILPGSDREAEPEEFEERDWLDRQTEQHDSLLELEGSC